MDRRAARDPRKPKPLPAKIGSFQIFLRGYKDANIFLREHPWPENKASRSAGSSLASLASSVTGNRNANVGEEASLLDRSVRVSMESDLEAGGVSRQHQGTRSRHGSAVPTTEFEWTPEIILQFQVQFEKLVILDYLMRNTDRGLDNWMVKYCGSGWTNCRSPQPDGSVGVDSDDFPLSDEGTPILNADGRYAESPSDSLGPTTTRPIPPVASEPQLYAEITSSTTEAGDKASLAAYAKPHIHIAAIDNGLAFPWKHPDRWRSYPYGWLYLSPSLTKRPFSQETRDAVLPILTSPQWWRETVGELRRLFALDSDFQEDMFERQAAILKGQGWNIVEALRRPGASPVHLVNRVAVAVWAEEVVTLESFDGERFWSYEDEDQDEEDYEPYHSDTTNTTTGGFSDSEGEAYDSRRPQRPPLRPFRRLSADYPPTKHSPSTHAWRQKLKSRMSMDATMFASRYRRRRPTIRKRMTERLEEFTRARPWFTWC
ncbi:MAG: phosphatidylinositol 3 and 4-kinase-domain-containing protein [Olpidium bornovanus]|uniref:Phosphatidylinositol 4-kinase n=1 Tax=Olpidium bornovanus TaxID=278681 RepID=A0A8H8DKT5_9FUNG|nr:MAG: phosphatidylinositol 3 and 4-kinase-domain-containing protein [Olpidium bornovanus]